MSIEALLRASGSISIQPVDRSKQGVSSTKPLQSEFNNLLTEASTKLDNASTKLDDASTKLDDASTKLYAASSTLKLSEHAKARIYSRSIQWDESIEKRVSTAIDRAMSKGSRDVLILADDLAVIANVKSRTVVTAMDKSQLKEKIFTKIDSAVLV